MKCRRMEMTTAYEAPAVNTILAPGADSLKNILLKLENNDISIEGLRCILPSLKNVLQDVGASLDAFQNDVPVSLMLQYFDWIDEGKSQFYPLYRSIRDVEPTIEKVLDFLESVGLERMSSEDLPLIFNTVEEIADILSRQVPMFKSIKMLFDTALEFNEIFKDNMNSLIQEITTKLVCCRSLRERCSSLKLSDLPNLDRLLLIIVNSFEEHQIRMPTFSDYEKDIYQEFCALEESITPTETSLKDVLAARIKAFKDRAVVNNEYLISLLNSKYEDILKKHDNLVSEISDLKRNIVDKRWEIIFTNLNMELNTVISSVEKNLSKIENPSISADTKEHFKLQVCQKGEIISKTFDIIYKVLDASILFDPGISEVTNKLADRWLQLKDSVDPIFSEEKDTVVESIAKDLHNVIISETSPTLKPLDRPKRQSVGAFLLKRMNIKPVITTGNTEETLNVFASVNNRRSYVQDMKAECTELQNTAQLNSQTMGYVNNSNNKDVEQAIEYWDYVGIRSKSGPSELCEIRGADYGLLSNESLPEFDHSAEQLTRTADTDLSIDSDSLTGTTVALKNVMTAERDITLAELEKINFYSSLDSKIPIIHYDGDCKTVKGSIRDLNLSYDRASTSMHTGPPSKLKLPTPIKDLLNVR
ncbi:HCR016Cp [Eremothecium sinecaudum]|uniref:HCR016Cp n=1 Tax=Eremothecium sinecaudum TaxID=45286 RepID=A0A0X8HRN1_9SACH|nr:HCR016Cp [Eremothecium sinecaudum]AMD20166.1 HCR016Cp [Eremothecium sinecaudum]